MEGLSFSQAAIETVKSYAGPAFAGQLTTILALAPLMAISGTMGKFIRLIPSQRDYLSRSELLYFSTGCYSLIKILTG